MNIDVLFILSTLDVFYLEVYFYVHFEQSTLMGVLVLHGDGMGIFPADPLMQTAAPVPKVTEHLYVDVSLSKGSWVAVCVEPTSKDSVRAVVALAAVCTERDNGYVGLFELCF